MNKQTTTLLQSLALAALFATAPVALAVDGVKLIDMAKVAAGGLTPGDAPGFPVTISQPGSYALSGNLTVPNADTTAMEITASHVTIDLNGFAILGPTDCSAADPNPCPSAGIGSGISTPNVQFNITVRNGTVKGMGLNGVSLTGDSQLVEYLRVSSNGGNGIAIHNGGFNAGSSIAQHNTAQFNGNAGILVGSGMVSHNVASGNRIGLLLSPGVGYIGNVLKNQFFISVNVSGGVNLGQNLCNDFVCPGANF